MKRRIWIGVAVAVLVGLTLVGWRLYSGFKAVADEPFSPTEASVALEERTPEQVEEGRQEIETQEGQENFDPPEEGGTPDVVSPPDAEGDGTLDAEGDGTPDPQEEETPAPAPVDHARSSTKLPDGMFDSVLLMGADASGFLADAIVLALFPEDGSAPALISIPRDLYLYNLCSEDFRRVNANLGGCTGYANGPELLALAIEDFTGVAMDHFARVDFDGFVELVDGLGGIGFVSTIRRYDEKAQLTSFRMADGTIPMRDLYLRQLVDGEWQRAWSSAQKHQQDFAVDPLGPVAVRLSRRFARQSGRMHRADGPETVPGPGQRPEDFETGVAGEPMDHFARVDFGRVRRVGGRPGRDRVFVSTIPPTTSYTSPVGHHRSQDVVWRMGLDFSGLRPVSQCSTSGRRKSAVAWGMAAGSGRSDFSRHRAGRDGPSASTAICC